MTITAVEAGATPSAFNAGGGGFTCDHASTVFLAHAGPIANRASPARRHRDAAGHVTPDGISLHLASDA